MSGDRSFSPLSVLAAGLLAVFAAAPAGARDANDRVLGSIIDVRGDDTVLLDIGREHGVRERMVFAAYRPADVVALPMSDERAYVRERVVAKLVAVEVEGRTATARLAPQDGPKPTLREGDFVASDPYAAPVNIPPHISSFTASPPRTGFGTPVQLRAQWTDEPHDRVYFEWKATGGWLSHDRSAVAAATWMPPLAAGTYRVTITAVDTAGNRTERSVAIVSSGFTGIERNVYEPQRRLGQHGRLFSSLRDLTFDERNTAYLIDPSNRTTLIAMDEQWRETMRTLSPDYRIELDRAVVRDGHIYAIDLRETRAVRMRIHPEMFKEQPQVVYGRSGSGNGRFQSPVDIAVDGLGRVYVLDGDDGQPAVQIFEADGSFVASLGMQGGERGQLQKPKALAVSHDGALYVLCDGRKKVLVYEDLLLSREIDAGSGGDNLVDVKVDPFTGRVCVLDASSGEVRSFDARGRRAGDPFGAAGDGQRLGSWQSPKRLRFDQTGMLHLLSDDGKVIHRLDPRAGREVARWGGFDFSRVERIAAGPNGDIAVLAPRNRLAANLDRRGWIQAIMGGRGSSPGQFESPVDLQVDAEGNVLVLDSRHGTVQAFTPDGRIRRTIGKKGSGASELDSPIALGVDPTRRFVAVLDDRRRHQVKVYDVQGNLKAAFPGERDFIRSPLDIGITGSGIVYVAVNRAERIRYFNVAEALAARSPHVDPDDRNPLHMADWAIGGVDRPRRLLFSNLNFLLALRSGDYVQVINLAAGSRPLTQIQDESLRDPQDVAVDDYDRVYIWDAGREVIHVFSR